MTQLSEIEQIGFGCILMGLDLLVNDGRFTKAVLKGLTESTKDEIE